MSNILKHYDILHFEERRIVRTFCQNAEQLSA